MNYTSGLLHFVLQGFGFKLMPYYECDKNASC